jgi:hypothetical protein
MHCYDPRGLIDSSSKDGWTLGYIASPWPGPWPKTCGDLFVQAPDGSQAGIAWESKGPDMALISGPSDLRWGVFQILFPIPVFSEADLIRNFHAVLPLLQDAYRETKGSAKQ